MQNYFNYFTEIEEHFRRRRGSTLLLSTLDWALIETWKDAGIPLEAVLRGNRRAPARDTLARNFLHAAAIQLKHPSTGKPLVFERPLPRELQSFLRELKASRPAERV